MIKINITTLSDLRDKGSIGYGNGYVGTNVMDMEPSDQKIFLESTEITLDEKLKLNCVTAQGSEINKFIRSENKELLKNIKSELDKLKGKSMGKILYENITIER